MCRIDVHARLLILRKKSPLHSLILVCTFIDFEKKFPPARLFRPACLLDIHLFKISLMIHTILQAQKRPYYNFELCSFKNSTFLLHLHLSILGFYAHLMIFQKKIHPAQSYFGLHVYWFWGKIPPCTSIMSCTFNFFLRTFPPERLFCPSVH